ncbi:MAG: DNA recombination protein RmuC, partial [Rickettsiales bacterium]
MIILLSVLTISGFAGTILFAFSLKKYQKLYYELQVENKKYNEKIVETTREKEQIITEQQHHNSELEKKVLAFDQEREEIYQKALQEVANSSEDNETTNKLNLEIAKLNDKIEILAFQNEELLTEQANKQNILSVIYLKFADEVKAIQEKYANNIEQNLNIARLQLTDKNLPLVNISLPDIYNSLNLKPEIDLITQYNSENPDKIDYSLIFSANNTVLMIDGIFPDFLVNNQEIIESSSDEADNLTISATLKERIDFLANHELQQKITKTINEIENINYVDKIISCLYIPSEKILTALLQIDQNLFTYAQEKNINIFTPASLVNLINEARHQLLLENSLYDFQYLAEFIEQISSENSDINDDEIGSENSENNAAEFTANKQIDSLESNLENKTAQDENYKADITNIADEIAKQQQTNNLKPDLNLADEASADAYANTGDNINTDKLNISNLSDDTNKEEQSSATELNPELDEVTDIAENEIDDKELETNETLVSDSDMHVDKLNIGNFLDGANEEEQSSATELNPELDEVTDIAENEIDDKELETNETLVSDSDMHVDKLNIGNFLDGANEEEQSSATEPNPELD